MLDLIIKSVFENSSSDSPSITPSPNLYLARGGCILNSLSKFSSSAIINVNCSISNEPFDYNLVSNLDLVVNFGEYFDDSNDELLILPFGSHSIDLDQYFYEMIVLSVPIKLIHPGIEDGTLKSEILNRLKEFDINKEKSVNFDPRWNKLNELKK